MTRLLAVVASALVTLFRLEIAFVVGAALFVVKLLWFSAGILVGPFITRFRLCQRFDDEFSATLHRGC